MRLHVRTAPARRLFAALLATGAALAAPAAQAQLIYPHSPAEENAANQAKEGLDAAKKVHLEAIDAQKKYLEEAVKREIALATERDLALRDSALLHALDARNGSAAAGVSDLSGSIRNRLSTLTGQPRTEALKHLTYFRINNRLARDARNRIEGNLLRLKRQSRLFEAAGGEAEYCDETGQGASYAGTDTRLDAMFTAIRETCALIAADHADVKKYQDEAPAPFIAVLLGDVSRAEQMSGSEIGWALGQEAAFSTLSSAQRQISERAAKHLKELKKYHACEVAEAAAVGEGGTAGGVEAAARSVQTFVDWLSARDTAAPSTLAEPPAPEKEGDSECAAPAPPEGGLLSERNRAMLDRALLVADDFGPLRTLTAAAEVEAQKFQSGLLGEIVAVLADPAADTSKRAEAAAAASLMRLANHADRLKAARAGKTPDLSGVLVRLAAADLQHRTAQLEKSRLERLRQLSSARTAALVREVEVLSGAAADLEGAAPDFDEALLEYSDSWTVGRIPATALHYQMLGTSYSTWVDRERAVVEAAYAALEPGVAELQTYGSGGLKPSDVAGYLQVLGLGAIAVRD
jgi:hypothetical protein